jgi:hypothetical protein
MAKRLAKQLICARPDCKAKFAPRIFTQKYCSPGCKNLEAQRRFERRQAEKQAAVTA